MEGKEVRHARSAWIELAESPSSEIASGLSPMSVLANDLSAASLLADASLRRRLSLNSQTASPAPTLSPLTRIRPKGKIQQLKLNCYADCCFSSCCRTAERQQRLFWVAATVRTFFIKLFLFFTDFCVPQISAVRPELWKRSQHSLTHVQGVPSF